MVLELHVWGPAFSLPSIDAHCLAAIAYLQQAVPRGEWQLLASSDAALSPTNELPALRNGDIWIGGFRNIFHYIAQYSAGEWVLDAGLPELEGADCIAFSSFVESHGQPLLDLSLYVSSQNYTTITRPIYNTIQPFPLPYLTPPSVRSAAKLRTSPLGLSSLDLDSEAGPHSQDSSVIPESLRRPKPTVSSLLAASPERNVQIRLDALATSFFQPLRDLRGKKRYFVSEVQFSSLDCLALGYLSLMLLPDLPQPWLARTMRSKFPDLCDWVEGSRGEVFGAAVGVENAFLTKIERPSGSRVSPSDLPWQPQYGGGVIGVGGIVLASLADSIPLVGQFRRNTRMRQHNSPHSDLSSKQYPKATSSIITVSGIIAGVGGLLGFMFHQGLISLPFHEGVVEDKGSRGLGDLGEAGAALEAYAHQMDGQVQRQRSLEQYHHGGPIVEVDIEVQPGGP